MVEIITGVTLAARVAFIASYRGYKAESKREDIELLEIGSWNQLMALEIVQLI